MIVNVNVELILQHLLSINTLIRSFLKNDLYICNLLKWFMKSIYKIYILTFLLLSDFVLFAQPGDDDGGGGLAGGHGGQAVQLPGQ